METQHTTSKLWNTTASTFTGRRRRSTSRPVQRAGRARSDGSRAQWKAHPFWLKWINLLLSPPSSLFHFLLLQFFFCFFLKRQTKTHNSQIRRVANAPRYYVTELNGELNRCVTLNDCTSTVTVLFFFFFFINIYTSLKFRESLWLRSLALGNTICLISLFWEHYY